MILTSSNTLENKTVIEYKGLVTGESLIGSNIYKDLIASHCSPASSISMEEKAQLIPSCLQIDCKRALFLS